MKTPAAPPPSDRDVLQQRARLLARTPTPAPRAGELLEAVVFQLAGEDYALPAAWVVEVLRGAPLTPAPRTPAVLAGVTNLRGEVLPVFDLAAALGLARQPPAARGWVIVVGESRPELGLLCGAVLEIRSLRTDELLSPAAAASAETRELLLGVTPGALQVLDGARLVNDPRFYVNEGP